MSTHRADALPEARVALEVIRADGTRVPIGVVGRTRHRSRAHAWWWRHVTQPRVKRRIQAANRDAARRAAGEE